MSKAFGTRPYIYICPELKDPKNRLSIDTAIYLYGVRDEEERAKKERKEAKKNQKQRNSV